MFCKSTSIDAHAYEQVRTSALVAKKASGHWVCDECGNSFVSKGALTMHNKEHSWVPKVCDMEGCNSKTIFKSAGGYAAHQVDAHTMNPRTCPFEDAPTCKKPSRLFLTCGSFKDHLTKSHNLKPEEISRYIAKPASHENWVPIKCIVPECISST